MHKLTGERIGTGRNTRAYNHCHDCSKVILMGWYKRDLFKLAAYAKIGALYAVKIHDKRYTATVAKMDTGKENNHITKLIGYMYRLSWDIFIAHEDDNDSAILHDLHNRLDSKGQAIVDLFSLLSYSGSWFDNCEHNWLHWQGQVIPIDVFDPDSADLSVQSINILESIIDSYIERE